MTKPKISKVKKFSQAKFKFLWKAKLIPDGHEQKLWKLIIPISAKLNFLSSNEMPMKLKNYYKKQPILIFEPYNFDFSLYSIAWTENIRKDHFWIFW